jgi:leucyl aminopeptidase
MTSAALSIISSTAAPEPGALLVVGAVKEDEGVRIRGAAAAAFADRLAADLAAVGFAGRREELVRLPSPDSRFAGLAVIGLGTDEPAPSLLRVAAGSATRRIPGRAALVIDLAPAGDDDLLAIAEGAGLGAYLYTEKRGTGTDSDERPSEPRSIAIAPGSIDDADAEALLARASASVGAVDLVRDLVNVPALDLYPESYADRVSELAAGLPVDVTVWGVDELEQGGFGGILGVGRGSSRPPRLVRVDYSPEGNRADGSPVAHIALVGKGITFDSGGLSLKPPLSMIGMKDDMTGSAVVLAVALAAARLSVPVHITAWLCLAENMPSGDAIRPGDVLTARGGRTIEVLNTDAEGRLVLADGLVAASEEQPDVIVDVATLTGAAVTALGNRYTGTMGDDRIVEALRHAAGDAGELVWPMPLPEEMRALLNSDIADIANVKPGNTAGGMLVAGVFLKEFVGTRPDGTPIPWAHLDIAGPAYNKEGGWGYTGKGATGAIVRTLLRFAEMYTGA